MTVVTLMETLYMQEQSTEAIDAVLASGMAYRATEANEWTITVPVAFVDGVACVYVAVEGFVGYIPETDSVGITFVPLMIYASID